VEISESRDYYQEPMTLCRLLGEGKKSFSAVPSWMLDAGRCAAIRKDETPHVGWQALLELRRLIQPAANSCGDMIQHRHFPPLQGDADETVSATNMVAATGPVPGDTAADDVGEFARGGSKQSQADHGSAAQPLPTSTNADQ
jgi:hypothetical protein